MKKLLTFAGMVLLLAAGCRGWDDDSVYDIRTRAAFFQAPANGGWTLIELRDGALTPGWNTKAGFPDRDLSDVEMRDNALWLSSGNRRSIVRVNPETGAVEETFSDLPIAPHYFSVGEDQIIAADTSANALIFIKLRNGKVTEAIFEGVPAFSLYTNSRFYLKVNSTEVWVIDEKALTPRAKLNIGKPITDLQTNRFNNVHVQTRDTTGLFEAILPGNADYISKENFAVNYAKIRYTPYFSVRYNSEFLDDLQLVGSDIQTPIGTVLLSGAENFEADFFGGSIYAMRDDSLFVFDLSEGVATDSMAFPYAVTRVFHQYGGVE